MFLSPYDIQKVTENVVFIVSRVFPAKKNQNVYILMTQKVGDRTK